MTTMDTAAAAERISAPPYRAEASVKPTQDVHLKCPTCAWEVEHPQRRGFDFAVTCPSCRNVAEFRQWHEAWCASRREFLARMFPKMTWLASGYAEIVPPGGATHEHLRETKS